MVQIRDTLERYKFARDRRRKHQLNLVRAEISRLITLKLAGNNTSETDELLALHKELLKGMKK